MSNYVLGIVGSLVIFGLFMFISRKEQKRKPSEIQKELREKSKYLAWLNRIQINDSLIEEEMERIIEEIEKLEKQNIDSYVERPR